MKDIAKFEEWPYRLPNIKKVVEKIGEFTRQMKQASSKEEALSIWKKHAKSGDAVETEANHVSVLFTLDSANKKYAKGMDVLNEGMPLISAAEVEFQKACMESPFRPYLEQKLGSYLFQMYDYSLRSFDERIIEESIEENKLTTQYGALIAGCEVEFRGAKYNLPQMGKFMQDLDRATRKEASEAYYAYLQTRKDEIEEIFDKLVKVRDKMAKKLGYENYIPLGYLRMGRYDYGAADVAGYRDAIGEVVTPLAGRIYKAQFKRTGIRRPEIYDLALAFRDGNPTPKGTTLDKIEAAKKMYASMGEETSFWFNLMADKHLLDLEARPGKQSGGYMTNFPRCGVPFIFSNFNGTAGDVDVLTHEFGHSFQYCMSRTIKVPEYRMPTSESCEIHSMSMEFFAEPYMDLFFDDPVKYRYSHLADALTFLPYGVTVDEFQHWVYANPDATPRQRDEKWVELEKKYTPYIVACYGDCAYRREGGRWLTQSHIFENPFYYIDYTLAQVMAFQFFNLDRKDHEKAWKKYIKLCKMGGKHPFRTLVKKDGMKDPFAPGVIKKTIAPLVKQLKSYNLD